MQNLGRLVFCAPQYEETVGRIQLQIKIKSCRIEFERLVGDPPFKYVIFWRLRIVTVDYPLLRCAVSRVGQSMSHCYAI